VKSEEIKSDKVLDTRGLSSPMPFLKMMKALTSLSQGKILEVWCYNSDFESDFKEVCEKDLVEYLGYIDDPDGYTRYFIQNRTA